MDPIIDEPFIGSFVPFNEGCFQPYSPLKSELPQISEIFPFIENNQGNIPVTQTT